MDVKEELLRGLQSAPKYIPVRYRYDKHGSIYNDRAVTENVHYYFRRCEVNVLMEKIQEIMSQVCKPCVLVEMGSGNSEKTRIFLDAILERQDSVTYIPVDISEEFLKETSEALAQDYKDRVNVKPIPGDYSLGIEKLSNIEGNKLIVWLGGGFQNQAYDVQVQCIASLSKTMTGSDRLLIAADVTEDVEEVENAYLDPEGYSAPLYLNGIWRLNKEYGSKIDTRDFDLVCKFERESRKNRLSKVVLRIRSKNNITYNIPKLGIDVKLTAGEYINLYEGEGVSCKYTEDQIKTLVSAGNQTLNILWIDKEKHVALCFIKTQRLLQDQKG